MAYPRATKVSQKAGFLVVFFLLCLSIETTERSDIMIYLNLGNKIIVSSAKAGEKRE